MWIRECLSLYDDFVERASGKRPAPQKLEEALSEAKALRRIGSEVLRTIENSPDWPYPQWWPRLSTEFGEPLSLPRDDKEKAVKSLQERIKYIEVVSVVLRFVLPSEFGIMSPPVVGLLNLPQRANDEEHYLQYLNALEEIQRRYPGLVRIADVDMALWVAARLEYTEYQPILEEIQDDPVLQEIRLRNMVHGLGRYWKHSERSRLTLAEALLGHDHVTAALIAARCFESKVVAMAKQLNITAGGYKGEGKLGALMRKLERQHGAVPEGVSLDELKEYRNAAVHNFDPPISRKDAEGLLKGVRRLYDHERRTTRT